MGLTKLPLRKQTALRSAPSSQSRPICAVVAQQVLTQGLRVMASGRGRAGRLALSLFPYLA